MTKTAFWRMPCLAAALVLASSGSAEDKQPMHPSHLHHALYEMKLARTEAREAKHDYGGHRTAAILALDDAIRHFEYVIGHPHYKVHISGQKAHANDHHKHTSHVHHAVHALRHARHELKESKFDFGGRKELVLKETEVAVKELEHLAKHHKKK